MPTQQEIDALFATRGTRITQYQAARLVPYNGVVDHIANAMIALDAADREWLRAIGVLPPLPGPAPNAAGRPAR